MSALHSVWLMPAPDDEAKLRGIVEDLAGRFASPLFQPHLTLVEEQERELAEIAAVCRMVAAGTDVFSAEIRRVDAGQLYFRSLYALFPADGPLVALRRGIIEALSIAPLGPFMPHISLLYGIEPGVEKEQARIALERDLAGVPVCFDRISVVASAKTIPVADWAVRFTAALRPAGTVVHPSGRSTAGPSSAGRG